MDEFYEKSWFDAYFDDETFEFVGTFISNACTQSRVSQIIDLHLFLKNYPNNDVVISLNQNDKEIINQFEIRYTIIDDELSIYNTIVSWFLNLKIPFNTVESWYPHIYFHKNTVKFIYDIIDRLIQQKNYDGLICINSVIIFNTKGRGIVEFNENNIKHINNAINDKPESDCLLFEEIYKHVIQWRNKIKNI